MRPGKSREPKGGLRRPSPLRTASHPLRHHPRSRRGRLDRGNREGRGGAGTAPDAPVVLYRGTFTRYQGVELLLEAAAIVRARVPAAVFVLVGSEPREDRRIRELVEELTIEERVRIVPRRPREEMGYFAAADLLVSLRVPGDNVLTRIPEDSELAHRFRRGARRYARTRLRRPAFVQALQIHRAVVARS